jgi:hypothetical protein
MSTSKSIERGIRHALLGAAFVGIPACSSFAEGSISEHPPFETAPFASTPGFAPEGSPAPGSTAGGSSSPDGFADAIGDPVSFDGKGACIGQELGAEVAPAVLQLIVDTSGSMDDDAPGPVPGSKWDVTRNALLAAVDQMPAVTTVGVVFYPDTNGNNDSDNQNSCFDRQTDVPLQILADAGSPHRTLIRTAFQGQNPNGGTPTHDAYAYAVQDLNAAVTVGARFGVLITDGIPTFSLGCDSSGRGQNNAVDSGPLVTEAAQSLALGVKTFVIGSPGSEGARENLSRMAEAGGTAAPGCSHTGPRYCHFDMTGAQDFALALADALGKIAGLALGCNYEIPAAPDGAQLDPDRVDVAFHASGVPEEPILRSSGASCSDGWQYSPDGKQVVLCGSTCERVRERRGSLTLEFGCAASIR